jgi:hypothetical protein
MKKLLVFIFFVSSFVNCYSLDFKLTNISGETTYTKSSNESLNTKVYIEYSINLYEPPHKKWGLFISGKVNPSYDHFGKEIKTDVFTVLGIDF